ncbi:RpiB/LacA/LacB family sugar-phosphate isomerase [Mobiluncus mulieris]|uniref:RpiB/LacA/LacB family sugar-phosphate isomerase n=1 Tax=Mobiluncus mulieris TaxID=2052 RepID=UPI0014700A2E|nr:RpiB/LacA/LacB family sugar-phosphate isomerase [Mobiluncus mulieris]NMW62758.1 RpiB/LacA/LacB family sugar-phosphate isomerase [Mobiluncus mulieris]
MKIAFGCDPNAADLKLALIAKAQQLGHEVKDFGAEDPIYANTAVAVAKAVAAGELDRGVLVCGTGIGVSIAANKVKGAYCACVTDIYQAQRATLSNNANLIAMGSQVVGVKSAEMFLEEYLKYTFDPASRSGAKVARICEFERED